MPFYIFFFFKNKRIKKNSLLRNQILKKRTVSTGLCLQFISFGLFFSFEKKNSCNSRFVICQEYFGAWVRPCSWVFFSFEEEEAKKSKNTINDDYVACCSHCRKQYDILFFFSFLFLDAQSNAVQMVTAIFFFNETFEQFAMHEIFIISIFCGFIFIFFSFDFALK